MRERRSSLAREIGQQAALANLAHKELGARVRGMASELAQLQGAIATQTERLASSRKTFERHEELVRQQFVSEMQLSQQREQVLDQQARLQALERSRSAQQREIASLEAELAAHPAKAATTRAAIEREISMLDQQLTEHESRRTLVITAPADGVVTTILAERGQSATPAAPLLSILPDGATLQAQLFVPTRAVGFVAAEPAGRAALPGLSVPALRRTAGVVMRVSRTLDPAQGEAPLPVALTEPVYRITVALDRQSMRAYGQDLALQAGMLLDADIALDRRRLIEWLFDPILARHRPRLSAAR